MSHSTYHTASNTPLCMLNQLMVNYPVLTSSRNDLPICTPQTRDEAQHIGELFRCYVHIHNDHWSPYNQFNSDVLERRMYCAPDVEVAHFLDSPSLWKLSDDTAGALRCAFRQVRVHMGEMIQPLNWNKDFPWLEYDFESPLVEEGFPFLLEPEGVVGDQALTGYFRSLSELQERIHAMQFWAICSIAITQIWTAHTMHYNSNIMWCGFVRSSPALVSAEHHWRREMDLVPEGRSEDFLSDNSSIIESAIDGIGGVYLVSPIIHPDVDMTLTPLPRQLPLPPLSEDLSATPPFDMKAWAELPGQDWTAPTRNDPAWDRPTSPDGSMVGDGEYTWEQVLKIAKLIDHPSYSWVKENMATDQVTAITYAWSWQAQLLREFHASNYGIINWTRSLYYNPDVYWSWIEDGKGRHIETAEVAYLQDQATRKYDAIAEPDNSWSDKTVTWAEPTVEEVVKQLEDMHIDQAVNSLGLTFGDDNYVPRSA